MTHPDLRARRSRTARTTDLLIDERRDRRGRHGPQRREGHGDRRRRACSALPGLVDLHTHLREPGFEQSETVLTGSRAAAAGGFTAVLAMANTSPVQDTAGVVEQVASLGEQHGYVTVRPIGAVTVGLEGERLSEIGAMAQSRARGPRVLRRRAVRARRPAHAARARVRERPSAASSPSTRRSRGSPTAPR